MVLVKLSTHHIADNDDRATIRNVERFSKDCAGCNSTKNYLTYSPCKPSFSLKLNCEVNKNHTIHSVYKYIINALELKLF